MDRWVGQLHLPALVCGRCELIDRRRSDWISADSQLGGIALYFDGSLCII